MTQKLKIEKLKDTEIIIYCDTKKHRDAFHKHLMKGKRFMEKLL